ncbi:Endosialin Tumor endothelial marker 1 Precursor [Larimichthys crocea]|uniref:Endosialin Tumor endothelial marker 1 n=1 Tax=Larimichthys crocea TaxID=215358 RepID=A0A6G0I7L9_LARCR|nr:endosialin [Larimichthys crocea]KAE8287313.1 Endosialin Tumor endothelial marker 1 Precursor [Larimichthys crocea]
MSGWRMQKTIRSSSICSSMSLLCALWLLIVCLASGSRGQRLRETEGEQPAVKPQLAERDALCHQDGCYTVFLQKRTFREAGRSCRERGGTLATMHTDEAAGVVHELLSAIKAQGTRQRLRLWIGLHRPPRQCSSTRPLRGFVWVTGDQDGQFTNWLREDTPGTCAAPRCVAMTVHTSESGRESSDNFRWVDGSCALPLDGYVCQYNYKGMCPSLEDEGRGPAVYTTPFHLVSTLLTHVPYGSVATLPCPAGSSGADGQDEQTVLCMERDDETVGWSRDAPLCLSSGAPKDWCSGDHGCEQYCQNTGTDYYCYCSEGFTIDEDGYSCKPDPLSQTDPPELSSDSAGPTEQPHMKEVCVEMGCEYDCVETSRGIRCTCPPGYQMGPDGRRCSDVDECQQQPCPQVCVNIPGTFHCTCHAGYQPDDEGECVDIDECLDEGSCEDTCENTVGSFTCLCNSGYELSREGQCVDVDECVGESPCQQQCINYMGGYQCYCDNGYDMQSDGLTCQPSPDDEEYSTLTPDPSDSAHIPDLNPNHNIPWSTSFTPDPNFEADTNFDVDWLTEAPDVPHGSDNHLNQWDAQSPKRYQTAPSPTQKDNTGNEIDNDADVKGGGKDASDRVGDETANRSATGASGGHGSKMDSTEDVNNTVEAGAGSDAGKQKHDKSWLLVALLVPLCVFLVVMLALGIVYCTSCAVDKSLSFSDCYRWILPTTPPERRDGKTQA